MCTTYRFEAEREYIAHGTERVLICCLRTRSEDVYDAEVLLVFMHDLGSMKAAYTAATLDTDLERTQLVCPPPSIFDNCTDDNCADSDCARPARYELRSPRLGDGRPRVRRD